MFLYTYDPSGVGNIMQQEFPEVWRNWLCPKVW